MPDKPRKLRINSVILKGEVEDDVVFYYHDLQPEPLEQECD